MPEDPLARLKNLGPQSAAMLREVGVEAPEALREVGAVMAYKLLQHRFPSGTSRFPGRVNALFLYALAGALADRHWNSFSPEEKARLRAEADGDLEVGPG